MTTVDSIITVVERRNIPRPKPGSTLRRILDITFEKIRKTEAKKNEQNG